MPTLLNPMDQQGQGGNYIQANTASPASNPAVQSYPVGANMQSLTWPIPAYTQPNLVPTKNPAASPLGTGSGP